MLAARDSRASGTEGTGTLAGLNSQWWKSHQEEFIPLQATAGEGQFGPAEHCSSNTTHWTYVLVEEGPDPDPNICAPGASRQQGPC